jgi:hypothetical protein
MPRLFLRLFILLFTSIGTAQTIPKTENICFFQDAKTGKPITIVNDSLVYKGELKNPTILKHNNYPDALERYKYHFNIKNHTYLVHDGCGPVLEYRNDSIVRIDNSFLQKNQNNASPFLYKNQICLFGGYGLFTTKNIITRFDNKTKEWFRLYNIEEDKPNERSGAISYYNKKGLYILGGWNNNNSVDNSFQEDSKLWYLDFSTLKWEIKGIYNKQLKYFNTEYTFQDENKLYLITSYKIVAIDFLKNRITNYKIGDLIAYNKISFDQKTKSLYYLANLSGEVKLILEKVTLKDLLKNQINIEKLYFSTWQETALPILIILFTILLFIGIYKWVISKTGKHFVYHQSKNKFYFKSKIISNLDPLEEKILIYLFQNKDTYIQLNQLNGFLEKENPDNVANVIKKRDLVFASLFVKLNACFMHGENPLVLIKKNDIDKRIKEIKLNPLYFTLK